MFCQKGVVRKHLYAEAKPRILSSTRTDRVMCSANVHKGACAVCYSGLHMQMHASCTCMPTHTLRTLSALTELVQLLFGNNIVPLLGHQETGIKAATPEAF